MQGRLSSTSHASSPRVQAGSSRSPAQQGTSQRTVIAAANRGGVDEGSDDDDDNNDEDDSDDDNGDEDDDDESDEEDDGGSDGHYDSGDNENSVQSRVLKIFAIGEPNGLTMSEIVDPRVVQNQANEAS